ncbi:anthranilate synthase component I [Vagococcus entomophilus]|uniref:Anthranilate synthase component 1 n=1 Tax=Vagococcus entomophilus TaxID=1160095 RepID=A0A430AJU6_9ENTE|nr:anthranilate synthase component I [Vagococcus entomophilus]RSU08365.1 anthranilate synthase component I [Vagococcus entomophilus]
MKKTQTITADCCTVVAAYLRLSADKKCLLESIPRDKNIGRYSIIGLDPVHELILQKNTLIIDGHKKEVADPLEEIAKFVIKNPKINETTAPFSSGAIGYVGYDTYGMYEQIGHAKQDELGLPDCHFYVYETYLLFDHTKEEIEIVADNCYSKRSEKEMADCIQKITKELHTPSRKEQEKIKTEKLEFSSNFTQKEFINKVKKVKEYIQAGDIFQLVLSQRLSCSFTSDAFDYYRQLRLSNPSSYLYFLDFGETKVIGSSPESLVSVKGDCVTTNPIAGTRKRGKTPAEDYALAKELAHDEKEQAEHRMLVDLGRNDLGKVAKVGTVTVPIYMTIEKYRYVMHLVSVVEGTLKNNLSAMEALKATLPAGTVSGAPKIRAMQRIYELETDKRGIYAGAVGYLTKNNQADFAIAIRTMVVHKQKAYVQAGAGIVYDSDPELEYLETLQKAKALLEVGK